MKTGQLTRGALSIVLVALFCPAFLQGQNRAIDADHSVLRVRVFKTGFFSAFAHNHEVEAPISEGAVALTSDASVSLHIDARRLRVLDPEVSPETRSQIQSTMQGATVLDSARFPDISFQSIAVEPTSSDHWAVGGNLTLRGQTRPVAVDVALKDGHYRGFATLRQRDFGIAPLSIAGGTVKVKDEVEIEFDIVLVK
jgi:polyisoprenoid-binding protein YceI